MSSSATRASARLVLLCCLLASACHRAAGPEAVLASYFAHLRRGEIEAAYALTTSRHRARRDVVAFAAAVARQPLLDRGPLHRGELRVRVELDAEGAPPLVFQADGRGPLRLALDPLDFYSRATPEAAIASFVRAVEHQRRDRLTQLVTAPLRERLRVPARPGGLPADDALPEDITGLAVELKARLAPAAGMPAGLVEEWNGGVRFLLGGGAFVSLASTAEGWQIVSLP